MSIENLNDIEVWLESLKINQVKLLRFKEFPVSLLNMNYKEELLKHAENYLLNNRDQTFHHIRLLFKDLSTNKINLPLVGSTIIDHIHVHPGGSRLMVAKQLNIDHVPLDLLLHPQDSEFFNFSKPYQNILTSQDFINPYKTIDAKINFQFEFNVENKPLGYQANFEPHWHWTNDDVDNWIYRNSKKKCENLIDYYLLT
jgi:hypothetical protein